MGAARAEDAQGTPTQSHISKSILVHEDHSSGFGVGARVIQVENPRRLRRLELGGEVWGLEFGVWDFELGVWCSVFEVWCFGVWSLVFGVWCLVFGAWFLVSGA